MNREPVKHAKGDNDDVNGGKRFFASGDSESRPAELRPTPLLTMPPSPMPLTSFVGRESIVAAVTTTLRQPETRLLTLTGPGGVGKTRLALQVAGGLRHAFADGVGFIPLAEVRNSALVLSTIAHRLGMREGDRGSLTERLGALLARRHCLLVLDNFEQVAAAAPELTGLLIACSRLKLLVTSRAPLRVSGEHVVQIPPMALVAPGTTGELVDAEAVQLFTTRAEAANPGVTRIEASIPAIVELCARLDGLPLAIQLAAVRSSLLPPPVMLARMEQRLPMLTSGPHDQPARLRTMWDAIAWSYDLLTGDEQALFRRLGVFAGGFSLAAAVAVSGEREAGVLASLEALVDHSLVRAVTDVADEPRYVMLETIREFGQDQLIAAGEAHDVRERYARHFVALVERIDPEIDRSEPVPWLALLDLDRANLQAALAWLTDQGHAEGAQRLAAALWRYWRTRGNLTEGRDGLERALALPAAAPPAVRADAMWKMAYMLYYLGSYVTARDHFERSVALFAAVGDRSGEVKALDSLGILLRLQGDFSGAREAHERTLAMRRELGEHVGAGITLGNLGMVALQRGDLEEARARLKESIAIAREFGAEHDIAQRSMNLGRVELADDHMTAARSLAERALAIFESLGDQIGISMALELLGQVATTLGEYHDGAGLLVASLRLRLKLGLHRNLVTCVCLLYTS